jgi:hypothetical protein
MAVDLEYVANLVKQLDADKAERDAYIPEQLDFDTCDDDLCLWCN